MHFLAFVSPVEKRASAKQFSCHDFFFTNQISALIFVELIRVGFTWGSRYTRKNQNSRRWGQLDYYIYIRGSPVKGDTHHSRTCIKN